MQKKFFQNKGVIDMTKNYELIRELSAEAYEFALRVVKEGIEDGRYDFSDGSFAAVSSYETKMRKDACYEAHRQYIDVQLMLSGREIIGVEHIDVMHKYECLKAFEDGDLELFALNDEGYDNVITEGEFVILRPEDGHMPGVCIGKPEKVQKVVFKIPVKQ